MRNKEQMYSSRLCGSGAPAWYWRPRLSALTWVCQAATSQTHNTCTPLSLYRPCHSAAQCVSSQTMGCTPQCQSVWQKSWQQLGEAASPTVLLGHGYYLTDDLHCCWATSNILFAINYKMNNWETKLCLKSTAIRTVVLHRFAKTPNKRYFCWHQLCVLKLFLFLWQWNKWIKSAIHTQEVCNRKCSSVYVSYQDPCLQHVVAENRACSCKQRPVSSPSLG